MMYRPDESTEQYGSCLYQLYVKITGLWSNSSIVLEMKWNKGTFKLQVKVATDKNNRKMINFQHCATKVYFLNHTYGLRFTDFG